MANIVISTNHTTVNNTVNTFVIIGGKSLWGCGSNSHGQLGMGDQAIRYVFTPIPQLPLLANELIIKIVHDDHTLVLTSAGRVFGCGINELGQLGLGDTTERHSFTPIPLPLLVGDERIVQLQAGIFKTLVLTSAGRIFGCGNNHYGQLGLGDTTERHSFTLIPLPLLVGDERIVQLHVGGDYNFVLTSTGRVFSCGKNDRGQLGLGDTTECHSFTLIPLPLLVGDERVVQLHLGNAYNFLLTSTGRVFGCGQNSSGQLGLGDTTDRFIFTEVLLPELAPSEQVVQFEGTDSHIFALTSTGRVFGCGGISRLWLKNGARPYFKLIGLPLLIGDERVVQLSTYAFSTLALTSSGRLFICGLDSFGQLYLGNTASSPFFKLMPLPLLAGDERIVQLHMCHSHGLILTSSSQLFGLGSNSQGSLGLGDSPRPYYTFTPILQFAHPSMRLRGIEEATLSQASAAPEQDRTLRLLNLPAELLHNIFSFLPPASLRQLMQVCKHLRNTISEQYNQPVMSPNVGLANDRINLVSMMVNARQIYQCLPPDQQEAFRHEFLRCFPSDIHHVDGLMRLLPPGAL